MNTPDPAAVATDLLPAPARVIQTLICGCGHTVRLIDPWASECPHCGALYNGAGQRLAPLETWGWETDEHFY